MSFIERNYIEELSLLPKFGRNPETDWDDWKVFWDKGERNPNIKAGALVAAIKIYLGNHGHKKFASVHERHMISGMVEQIGRIRMDEVLRFNGVLDLIQLNDALKMKDTKYDPTAEDEL